MSAPDHPLISRRCMGWLPDYPDLHDYDESHREIRGIVAAADAAQFAEPAATARPKAKRGVNGRAIMTPNRHRKMPPF